MSDDTIFELLHSELVNYTIEQNENNKEKDGKVCFHNY